MKMIGIVGSRRRNSSADYRLTLRAFDRIYRMGDAIVSGGCKQGGDLFAENIADIRGPSPGIPAPIVIHYPDQSKLDPTLLNKNPRAAYAVINYARNTLIANDADVLIACVAKDRKGGTEDTIKKFLKKLGLSEPEAIQQGKLVLV